jgi:hypothetical protein
LPGEVACIIPQILGGIPRIHTGAGQHAEVQPAIPQQVAADEWKVPHEPIVQAWGRTKRLRGRDRDRPQLPT